MAEPPESKELELKSPDPAAASVQPTSEDRHDSPSDSDDKELHIDEKGAEREEEEHELDDVTKESNRNRLNVTKSVATDASVATGAPSTVLPPPAKPWYKQINPLRWGGIPAVPKERIVSREYTAGFFSKLTFQWMTPLMTVSAYCPIVPSCMIQIGATHSPPKTFLTCG